MGWIENEPQKKWRQFFVHQQLPAKPEKVPFRFVSLMFVQQGYKFQQKLVGIKLHTQLLTERIGHPCAPMRAHVCVSQQAHGEQRNHCLKYESDCVSTEIGIKL